jgi:hypothetical protein
MNKNSWIASFDIGYKNFSFHVDEVNLSQLSRIKNTKERYNEDGTPTPAMKKILKNVFLSGKTLVNINTDLTDNCVQGKKLDPNVFCNMTDLLDEYIEIWDRCDTFVIEKQMNFRGKVNPKALRLGQHCYSYFCIKYGLFKEIIVFPAYHKTQVLGAQKIKGKKTKKGWRWKSMDKPKRKKWSVVKASEILELRGESAILEKMQTVAKKDDLADTLTQCMAFVYLRYIDKSV